MTSRPTRVPWLCLAMLASLACTREPTSAIHLLPAAHASPGSWAHPAQLGPYRVEVLHYGSGSDKRRVHYGAAVDVTTAPVDLSEHLSLRTARRLYWGITAKTIPVNARVHMPISDSDDGRFPLIIMAHGAHSMLVDSELGYDYVGRHLASRGFIFASVDMNFVNPLGFGPPTGEMQARARLFLAHLEQWQAFDDTPGPFFQRADLAQVVFAGHSRGGEAALVAAVLNEWELDFEWQFGRGRRTTGIVRSVVALAPTERRYPWKGGRGTNRAINYLVLHGSHDGDVLAFEGLRAFLHTALSGPHLVKSAVFVHRGSHGQWNTMWGQRDHGMSSGRLLHLANLMPGRQQRQLAAVLMTAFLEATVRDKPEYLQVFRDQATRDAWFPGVGLVTRFQSGRFLQLAGFAEDERRTTGTAAGVALRVHGADSWTEELLPFRATGWGHQHNRVAVLGWRGVLRLDVDLDVDLDAVVSADVGARFQIDIDAGSAVHLAMAVTAAADLQTWRVEVQDANGQTASVSLAGWVALRPPLPVQIYRDADDESAAFNNPGELMLQSAIIPMAALMADNPRLSPSSIRRLSLRLNSPHRQELYLDDIGILR